MKKNSLIKKAVISVFCVLLAVVIVFTGIFLFYYPSYRKNKQPTMIDSVTASNEMIVMSSNLRCISPTDLGKKSWFYRANLLIKNLQNETPDIIGFQESTKWHYRYLCDVLPEYASVIEYRDNSPISEGCPIFYRTDKFNLIDDGSFWLSETPEKSSKSWDAAFCRVCSYVILECVEDGKQFVVFNTHLDHVSDMARINGIGVILDKIKEFHDLPSVIMGDFNCTERSETYESATQFFSDVKYLTDKTMQSCTYQNFGKELDRDCIDYIMISKNGFRVNSYHVVTTTYDGVYPSDHFPIAADLVLE